MRDFGHAWSTNYTPHGDRFGVEPEIIAKLACTACRIYEVGISCSGRTYAEGKKINWKDGVRAIYAIVKYNLQRPVLSDRTYARNPNQTGAVPL